LVAAATVRSTTGTVYHYSTRVIPHQGILRDDSTSNILCNIGCILGEILGDTNTIRP